MLAVSEEGDGVEIAVAEFEMCVVAAIGALGT